MNTMKISVIVPVYNVRPYLVRCIKSICTQSYHNLEIILVDDGSTDGSENICNDFARNDVRVKVVHKKNGGLVSARKKGSSLTTGEYILNIDGDDWIENQYIEKYVREIKKYHPDVVWNVSLTRDYSNYSEKWYPEFLTGKDIHALDTQQFLKKYILGEYGFQNDIEYAAWSQCVQRDVYLLAQNAVDERIKHGEDVTLSMLILSQNLSVRFICNFGYHYIQRSTSMVRKNDDSLIISDRIMYNFLKQKLSGKKDSLGAILEGYYKRARLLHDVEGLQSEQDDYLVPYKRVKKNSKVVVYGAGIIGQKIISYLKRTKNFELVAWIDSRKHAPFLDIKIDSIAFINKCQFDFVILATNKVRYAHEMKRSIMEIGVLEDKIAMIDDAE